jgi:hypothetical protein
MKNKISLLGSISCDLKLSIDELIYQMESIKKDVEKLKKQQSKNFTGINAYKNLQQRKRNIHKQQDII